MSEVTAGGSQSQAPHPDQGESHRGGRRRRGGGRGGQQGSSGPSQNQSRRPASASSASPAVAAGSTSEQTTASQNGDATTSRGGRGGRGGRGQRGQSARGSSGAQSSTMAPRRTFGGHLTSSAPPGSSLSGDAPVFVPGKPVAHRSAKPGGAGQKDVRPRRLSKSSAPDLPTRIHEDIENGQYECVICTSEVVRTSNIWSCSICWTVTHLHCVKAWYKSQTRKPEQPQNPDEPKTWRCPGCNSAMSEDPGPDSCWCGKDINHRSIAGLPPHSCGQTCWKSRVRCPHPCPLPCHAGPCPRCSLMGPTQYCFCGKQTSSKRCTETDYSNGWSCNEVCGELLPCGEHICQRNCHEGLCGGCELPVVSDCYCGKSRKEIPCEEREDIQESYNHGQRSVLDKSESSDAVGTFFDGSYHCGETCGRVFDCGQHTCQRPCHVQDEAPARCPFSPDVVSYCHCGKTPLMDLMENPRQSCQDEIPRCGKDCEKLLACGHQCASKCHAGNCPPCSESVSIPCRCGRTSEQHVCHTQGTERPVCSRVCRGQLNCGRHECGRTCCAGEKRAAERQAAKRKRNANPAPNEEYEAEHICLRTCGRPLKCGKHVCEQRCHRGACGSCPEAIFDEISCACGRTVLQPPQPCGTRPPECRYECTRARTCGHPEVTHNCHPADASCPKCPFLVDKICVCGKQNIKNKACGLDEVHCGLPCDKVLKCGIHRCKLTCHRPGQCEDVGIVGSHCTQPCGKLRKSCEHECLQQCHSPYACKEDKPCQSKTFVTCECQRRRQEVKCLASTISPSPTHEPLKCDDECQRVKRNARLAQALKIDPATHTNNHIPYSDTTLKYFRDNLNWAQAQEREFRVFAENPQEKRLNFKPMPSAQRAFLHALAEDYGLDSHSQDPEPHRHVSIFKTPRFVSAPMKTLAQCLKIMRVTATQATASLATVAKTIATYPFNAIILGSPRFGLTIDELDTTLAPDLAAQTGPPLSFTTSFLASDEVVIKATPIHTAASIARSGSVATPAAMETTLVGLKPAVERKINAADMAASITLGYVDDSGSIVRREGDSTAAGGWSAVVGRAARRPARPVAQVEERQAPRAFVALKKAEPRKKPELLKQESVEDDWEAAAEKMETSGSGDQGEGGGNLPV